MTKTIGPATFFFDFLSLQTYTPFIMSEIWKLIQSHMEAAEREERAKKLAEQQRRTNIMLGDRARVAIGSLFEEVRSSDQRIKGARQSRVAFREPGEGYHQVILQWGNKLEMTSKELEFWRKYQIKPGFFTRLDVSPPKEIVDYDGYAIYSDIRANNEGVNIYGEGGVGYGLYHSAQEVLSDLRCVLPNIAKALLGTRHIYRVYRKGSDYWKEPPPPEDIGHIRRFPPLPQS